MATQAYQSDNHRLLKVGQEGFALLDEFFGRPKKQGNKVPAPQGHDHRYHQRHYQQTYIYWGPQIVTVKEPVLDSNEAAQLYGGKLIVEHCMGKPIRNY